MPEITIPYGRGVQRATLPDSRVRAVLTPAAFAGEHDLAQQRALVCAALDQPSGSEPLETLVRGKKRVLLITSDHTRPVPSRVTMPILLSRIRQGAPDAEIRILLATGMHRPTTQEEIEEKFGAELARSETILTHVSTDSAAMTDKGVLPSGGRLLINGLVDWAELVLAEGFIEPHFFAGFSGGRKAILPGIASAETVRYNHNARFIADPNATQGRLDGNPLHTDMRYAAKAAGLRFILNVLIDAQKRVVAAVAGDPFAAHEEGCKLCLAHTGVQAVQSDIAVTSNGGYPLDQNIYQAVKGMTSAEKCVRPGGVIIMLAECADGHGGEGFYRALADKPDAQAAMRAIEGVPPERTASDQWEAQILARVLCRATVILVTAEKNRETAQAMHMRYAPDLDAALRMADELLSPDASVTVIPDGVGVIVQK